MRKSTSLTPLSTPCYKRRVGAKALCGGGLVERRIESHAVRQEARVGDHDAIVDTKTKDSQSENTCISVDDSPLIGCIHGSVSLASHGAHHVLQTLVASYSTHN